MFQSALIDYWSNMKNDEFFRFIEMNGGDTVVEILKVQCINNVQSLLKDQQIFSQYFNLIVMLYNESIEDKEKKLL